MQKSKFICISPSSLQ